MQTETQKSMQQQLASAAYQEVQPTGLQECCQLLEMTSPQVQSCI